MWCISVACNEPASKDGNDGAHPTAFCGSRLDPILAKAQITIIT